jgi:hypothetical protein
MSEKPRWLDNPNNVKKLIKAFVVICGLLFFADLFYHRHYERAWEGVFGFYALYGFVACVTLVLAATQLRKLLMRRESFYDDE